MRLELLQQIFTLLLKVSPVVWQVVVPLVSIRGQYLHFLFVQTFLPNVWGLVTSEPMDLLGFKLVVGLLVISLVEELESAVLSADSLLRNLSKVVCLPATCDLFLSDCFI
jgi:hypothetical protein